MSGKLLRDAFVSGKAVSRRPEGRVQRSDFGEISREYLQSKLVARCVGCVGARELCLQLQGGNAFPAVIGLAGWNCFWESGGGFDTKEDGRWEMEDGHTRNTYPAFAGVAFGGGAVATDNGKGISISRSPALEWRMG